ncbi:hypothetical protein ACJA29_01550 [Metamycoplasma sualvi]|uniref:hypothetical protein n=1 Tax=Metamycoplasma sualvi TaxID=2125 RepID=UPI003873660E
MSIISKKKMNELLNLSNDPKIELVEETKKSYKIKITGDKDKVKKSSFENKVLEFMSDVTEFMKDMNEFVKEQKEFNHKVDQRLSVLESFHKDDFKKNTNHKR